MGPKLTKRVKANIDNGRKTRKYKRKKEMLLTYFL